MFDYYDSDAPRRIPRDEPAPLKWGIRLFVASLIVASVIFFGAAPCKECADPQRHRIFGLLFLLTGASAWAILVLRLRPSSDDTWFYGFFKRMVKAALIVLGGEILTVMATIVFLRITHL
jgi:hypothetical protein